MVPEKWKWSGTSPSSSDARYFTPATSWSYVHGTRTSNVPCPVKLGTRRSTFAHAMISTHVVLRAPGARFTSPLEADGCENVNTWPVLATDDDSVVVGAAMILPDHPQLAPESRGSLYDGTEIEEALLLHVLALSDGERAQIAAADPAVRAMVERAAAATPEELLRLHGRLEMKDG